MPFLDKEGLAHFWNQILAKLSKYETTENAQIKLDEAKSYTDSSIPTKVTDLENDAEYITASALSGLGGGDMLKATYDTDDDGVVDEAEHAYTADTATKATKDGNGNIISTYYMKRGTYERIEGSSSARKNLNDYTTAGFYNVKTAHVDNCPSGIGIDAVLLVYPWDSSGYECQEITESAASVYARRWIRHKNGSTWTAWEGGLITKYEPSTNTVTFE